MIAILPLSRCLIEEEIQICDSVTLMPPGEWEGLESLEEMPLATSLASVATVASGFTDEVIRLSPLVVYKNIPNLAGPLGISHQEDLFFLQKVVAECESRLDIPRFDMCRLDLPETLFGRVGTWDNSNGASGVVFLDSQTNKAQFIGGRYLVSTVTAGIGLDFDRYRPSYEHRKDEIGNVIKQALTIYRHALEANDWTSKYVHCVRLFEVLADPFQLTSANKWEKVRTNLCAHVANDKGSFLALSARFKLLGNIGDGSSRGLRERVIHHGELLENIYDSSDQVKALFKEVQRYINKVLGDLMNFEGESWQQVNAWRDLRLKAFSI